MSEQWTPEKVAARFEECVHVLNQLPDGASSEYSSYWPEIIYSQEEINRQPSKVLRLRPLPDAIDRMEETLTWIMFVEDEYKKLVWLRACGTPWRKISRQTGFALTSAQRYWSRTMQNLVEALKAQGK